MYTLNVVNGSLVDAFLNFMLTSLVQQQASLLHYIPISDVKFSQLSAHLPGAALSVLAYLEERRRYLQ